MREFFKNKEITIPLGVFLGTFIILSCCYVVLNSFLVKEERGRYEYIGVNKAIYISNCFDRVLVHAYTLREMVIDHDGNTEFFESIAPTIYQTIEVDKGIHLRNVALAPRGTIIKAYPLARNEEAIDYSLMDASKPGNMEAIEALRRERTILTNPYDLVQGGQGISARTPIFLQRDGEPYYWGLATMTFDYNDLIEAMEFGRLDRLGASYELWYDNDDGEHITITGSASRPVDPLIIPVNVYNLNWRLSIAPEQGWYSVRSVVIESLVVTAISALAALLVYSLLRIKRINRKLKEMAERDSLTMCYSRHYLNSTVVDVISGDWLDKSKKYSLAIIDVDNFKIVNDTFGHEAGDRVLCSVAEIIRRHISTGRGDLAIRFGGDEFVILWNDISFDRFKQQLTEILNEVRELHFDECKGLTVTLSIGGEGYSTPENSLYNSLLHRADEKLYWAKDNGRNQFVV